MKNLIYRGNILRAKTGNTAGHYYLLVRTMSGKDTNFLGGDLCGGGAIRYAFNLVNITDVGKARQTEVERQFVSLRDGVCEGLFLADLEQHYGMGLEDVTSIAEIKVDVKELLDEKKAENDAAKFVQQMLTMPKVHILGGVGLGKVVPLFAPDGHTVLAYVTI